MSSEILRLTSNEVIVHLGLLCSLFALAQIGLFAQAVRIPQYQNLPNRVGQTVGVTAIDISWNAPSVRGREGKIGGTSVVPYGSTVLGFGSNVESPWR